MGDAELVEAVGDGGGGGVDLTLGVVGRPVDRPVGQGVPEAIEGGHGPEEPEHHVVGGSGRPRLQRRPQGRALAVEAARLGVEGELDATHEIEDGAHLGRVGLGVAAQR